MAVQDLRTAQDDVQSVEPQRLHAAFQMAAEFGDDDVVDEQVRHGEMAVQTGGRPIQAVRIHLQPDERLVAQLIDAVQSLADFLQFCRKFRIRRHRIALLGEPLDEFTCVREPSVHVETDPQALAFQAEHELFIRFERQLAFGDFALDDGIMMDAQKIQFHAMRLHRVRNPSVLLRQAEPVHLACDSPRIDDQWPGLRVHVERNALQHDAVEDPRLDAFAFQQRSVPYSEPFVTCRSGQPVRFQPEIAQQQKNQHGQPQRPENETEDEADETPESFQYTKKDRSRFVFHRRFCLVCLHRFAHA